MSYFIGVDVGTGSARAALVDENGKIHSVATCPITTWNPMPDFYQQSSDDIWCSCCSVIKKVKENVPKEKIKGIGFDATCSLVVVDESGQPVSVCPDGNKEQNVILWMDHRAKEEADFINSLKHRLLQNVGGKISLEMEIPKLLWLKKHLFSQSWTDAGKFFDLPDFLTWKATGVDSRCIKNILLRNKGHLTTFFRSLCSLVCKWMYEVSSDGQKQWNLEFMKQIGLEELLKDGAKKIGTVINNVDTVMISCLGNLVKEPGEAVGAGLSREAASTLDLEIGTAVGTSIIDAHAGGLGLIGSHSPTITPQIYKRIGLICGTSTCHMAVSDKPLFVPGVWGPYWSAMVPGMWLNEAGQSATGKLVDHIISTHPAAATIMLPPGKHMVDHLNSVLQDMAERKGIPIDLLTKDFHVWPDFHGNRSPVADPTLKGMVSGLDLGANEEHLALLYLATVQALAYGTKHIMEVLSKEGYGEFSAILVCGGLSKNKLFLQTQSSVSGTSVLIPEESESVLLGAAMLGATASGFYPSVSSAIQHMSGGASIVAPDSSVKRYHDLKYEVFLKMLNDQMSYRQIMSAIK